MGIRRKGREYALQMLFAMDLTEYLPEEIFSGYKAIQDLNRDAFAQSRRLVEGFFANREEIDGLLSRYAKNWKISRMAVVDRNLLRLAIYELKFQPDIPFPIVLNEALEMSREFSEEDSSPFINGILDTARRELRPDEANGKAGKKMKPKEQQESGESLPDTAEESVILD
jgi:N utilization substance protein B